MLVNFIFNPESKELWGIADENFKQLYPGERIIAQFNKGEDTEQFMKAIRVLRPDIKVLPDQY